MEIHERLDELTGLVESARSVPMSASCVVNRTDLLALVDDIRRLLPIDLHRADSLLADADAVLAEARAQAEGLLAAGQDERMHLVSETEVQAQAEREAGRILATAQQEAERRQREVDDYIDSKLANFELVLSKTLEAVALTKTDPTASALRRRSAPNGHPGRHQRCLQGPVGRSH